MWQCQFGVESHVWSEVLTHFISWTHLIIPLSTLHSYIDGKHWMALTNRTIQRFVKLFPMLQTNMTKKIVSLDKNKDCLAEHGDGTLWSKVNGNWDQTACLPVHKNVSHLPILPLFQYSLARMKDPNIQPHVFCKVKNPCDWSKWVQVQNKQKQNSGPKEILHSVTTFGMDAHWQKISNRCTTATSSSSGLGVACSQETLLRAMKENLYENWRRTERSAFAAGCQGFCFGLFFPWPFVCVFVGL